ncbi:MAG: STAS/SEC14 domain-containing protein [Ardenticatenaceae bacterium]|nr:STAS/SEC14 domain-containing protein [Ardenticatenaceae bacterium]
MTTLEIKSKLPLTDLLESLQQLESDELGEVAATAVRLRANRRANVLPENEAHLLQQINGTLTPSQQERMNLLIEKRQQETLTKPELAELIQLGDLIEEIQVKRLTALIELAAIRNVSLANLKKSLNFPTA